VDNGQPNRQADHADCPEDDQDIQNTEWHGYDNTLRPQFGHGKIVGGRKSKEKIYNQRQKYDYYNR
jgi:hypothetical protein